MIKRLMPIFVMAFIAVSCNNDLEDTYLQSYSQEELDKDSSGIEYNDMSSLPVKVTKTRASNDVIVEDELVVVYGSDRTVSAKKEKIALNRSAAAKFGLSQGVYIVEHLLCYKHVYKSGYDIWAEESAKCGYKPSYDFVLGNNSIAITNERGYEEPASNAKELKTFVLHVICDIYGQRIDRYAPCDPKDIEWKYSISLQ